MSSSHLNVNPELLRKENELRALNEMLNQQTHATTTSTTATSPSFLVNSRSLYNSSGPGGGKLSTVPYEGTDYHNEQGNRDNETVSSSVINNPGYSQSSSPRTYQLPSSSPPPLHHPNHNNSNQQQETSYIAGERAMASLRPESQYNPGTKSPSRAHHIALDTRSSSSPLVAFSSSSSPKQQQQPLTSSSGSKKINTRIPTFNNKKRSTIGTTSAAGKISTEHYTETEDGSGDNNHPSSSSSSTTKHPNQLSSIELDPDLPLEMQIKVLKSHVYVARTEAQDSSALASRLAMELAEARKETGNIAEERQRLKRTATAAETALEKARKAASLAETREQELRQQITTLQKEATTSFKVAKQAESSSSAMDARLVRAQEEIDRLKSQLVTERNHFTEINQQTKREIETLQSALKKLERQKTELLITFKKQIKLIDILKRQRVQMEAARMLAFTEEEFARILDAGV